MDQINTMAELLRRFEIANSQSVEQEPVYAPRGLRTMRPDSDQQREDRRIERFLQEHGEVIIDERFKNLPDITEDMTLIRDDFPDGDRLKKPALILSILSDKETAELGRRVLPMLKSGISLKGVAELFLLACQLKDPSTMANLFADIENLSYEGDQHPSELSDNVTPTGELLRGINNDALEASAYSYLAASLLRLYAKPDESYVKAYNHIKSGYQRFYRISLPIATPSLNIKAIARISRCFNQMDIFKNTLFRILYLSSANENAKGLKSFLYETHLSYTGLHIVDIFFKLCDALECDHSTLLSAINPPSVHRDALRKMLVLASKTDDDHKKKMWRFGRIFDDAFMYRLQTRMCPELVYTLAKALQNEAPDSNRDILKIKQFDQVRPDKKRNLDDVARRIPTMVIEHRSQLC